jgi:hypothetical protein
MLIKNYGLFWELNEVQWVPGKGRRRTFRLLGRRGRNRPGLRLADFRYQVGIYILYGNYGPHYVGLTRKQGLGKRLKDHLFDIHAGWWDRFSWFGFCETLEQRDHEGFRCLDRLPVLSLGQPAKMIGDIEALLIRAMGLRNRADMKFASEQRWEQVRRDEVNHFVARI